MQMKNRPFIFLSILLVFFSCTKSGITPPPFDPEANLDNTVPVSNSIMENMEGIYKLTDGKGELGVTFVCKVSKNRVSFFSDKDGIYIILKYGLNPADSSIQFAGFWRYSEYVTQGNIGFSIAKDEGAADLIQNSIADHLKIKGLFQDVDLYTKNVSLEFERHFTQYAKDNEFIIFAHHGIQTTANPPYAENSINVVLNAESYGLNALEFDVRMTKDNVPICIHDPTINTRLTVKGPLSGSFDQYPFSMLSEYVRLIDGQKIPSVEQVLTAFVESTNLKYLWFDIKGNPGIFKYMEPIVRNAYERAAVLNRDVVIFAGLPSADVIAEFQSQSTYATLPTLCELEVQDVIDNHCQFWGPRYSRGTLLSEVDQLHSMGVKVFSWTLNDRSLIQNYFENGKFDGFISDYPAYVVYEFYTRF
jgi:glycerophosphoryl diester phosphodiesterase